MEHEKSSVEMFEKFTWRIENFSRLNSNEITSEPFVIGGYPWRISLFPRGVKEAIRIFLEVVPTANMSKGWSRDVKFKIVLFNQLNTDITIIQEANHEFNESFDSCGFESFIELSELHDPNKGFIVEDACIIAAEVFVCNSKNEKRVKQATANSTTSLTSGSQTSHIKMDVPRPNVESILPVSTLVCIEPTKDADADFFLPSIQELMDFNTVEQLEELCSNNERPRKRSRKFTDLAFAALGRVLCFVKTRKLKDMNDQACKDLKVLWDEVEKFRFDLRWLEPIVQSYLGMKSCVEKALEVKKLKENFVALELEKERVKAKLAAAELSLDVEKDLLKAKGLKERDLNFDL